MKTELNRFRTFRLIGMIAALPWWLVATGHTQDSGTGCGAQVMDRGCETAQKSFSDSNQTHVPSTAEQPVVTYRHGKLMVTAGNASLAQVLRAISAQTGTVIDFPRGSAEDRVVVREGPGTVREVLGNLLNGSGFNYVIVGSLDTPDKLSRVVLAKAGQASNLPLPGGEQKSGEADQAKTVRDPLLWTAPSGSAFWTPPEEDPSAEVSHPPLDNLVRPDEPIPPDVLEQMMKDRARQLREQAQEPQ